MTPPSDASSDDPPAAGYVEAADPPLPDAAFRLINPVMKALLRSPLHGLLSDNLIVLEFTGAKSGREYATPVGYWQDDDRIHVTTRSPWWRNFQGGAPVTIWLRGERRDGVATPRTETDAVADYVQQYIDENGLEAAMRLGLRFDGDRAPTREELEAGLADTVVVEIELTDD